MPPKTDPVAAATEVAVELIRTASAFLRQTVNASAEAALVVSPDQTIIHASEFAEEMFGYSPGELNGQSIRELVPESLREAHDRHFAGFLQEPRARPMRLLEAVPGLRRDGTTIMLQAGLSPISAGGELQIVMVIRRV